MTVRETMKELYHEVVVNTSDSMLEKFAYLEKQLQKKGESEFSWKRQRELLDSCENADDVLATLAYLIKRGMPVPQIIADIRLFDVETIRLSRRAHSDHHRTRMTKSAQVEQPVQDVEKANQPSLMPVFRAPALAATL